MAPDPKRETCASIADRLPAYAIDALDADGAAGVEQHLSECDACRERLAALREVTDALNLTVAHETAMSPPPELRGRVLAQLPATSTDGRDPAPRRRWLIAALVSALLLSLATNLLLGRTLASERRQLAELAGVLDRQEVVLEVVDSDATTRRFLRPSADAARASRSYGKVFTRSELPYVVVMAARLPPAPPGREYRVWLTRADGTVLSERLLVNADGFGLWVDELDSERPGFTAAVVALASVAVESVAGREGAAVVPSDRMLAWVAEPRS